MNDVSLPPGYLGAVTEARFQAAFASTAIATASTAADLLGVDVKTLGAMTERGAIRSVPRGKNPGYTERDLRAFLIEGPGECPSTVRPRAASTTSTSSSRVVDIMDLQGSQHDAQRRSTRTGSGTRRPKAG